MLDQRFLRPHRLGQDLPTHLLPDVVADLELALCKMSLNFTDAQQVATACGTHVPRQPTTKNRSRGGSAAGESWLTAAIPMKNPYCSCKPMRLLEPLRGATRWCSIF